MAVARHPVARIAPPAPAIISASRARVGERNGERGDDLCGLRFMVQLVEDALCPFQIRGAKSFNEFSKSRREH